MFRKCKVNDKEAYFHKWNTHQGVVEASPFVGGAPAGQIQYTLGLVEYEDGTMAEVTPQEIKFIDKPEDRGRITHCCDVAMERCVTLHGSSTGGENEKGNSM